MLQILKRDIVLTVPIALNIPKVSGTVPDHNRGTLGYAGYDSAMSLPSVFERDCRSYPQVVLLLGEFCLSHQPVSDLGMTEDVLAQVFETGLGTARRIKKHQLQQVDDLMLKDAHRCF